MHIKVFSVDEEAFPHSRVSIVQCSCVEPI
jgi:hypothetical protein